MHRLMSFVCCIGTVRENSGLEPWLNYPFAGVPKILTGKKFPMNVRALRFVVPELLRDLVDDMIPFDDLQNKLDYSSRKNVLGENLIRLVCLIMLFVRAEREGI